MAQTILWQRFEGLLLFGASLLLFWHGNGSMPWWVALLVFFAPDLSFLGYILGPRVGALGYNAVHIYGFGAVVLAIGLVAPAPPLASLGLLWLAHAGFDRMLGYGLKSPEGFDQTHLGPIGRRR